MTARRQAVLVLEDGRSFRGEAFGSVGETFGEAVFNTGMTGYQETLTDPSYHRQVVVQTAPQIGNTGVNGEDDESGRIWVSGYVVRDPSRSHSNWRASGGLEDRLAAEGIVGICGLDTRALTRHLRDRGAMRVGVSSVDDDPEAVLARVRQQPGMAGANLVGDVTTRAAYTVDADGEHRYTVAALDLGIKRNTPRRLAARGVRTHVLPATATVDEVLSTGADALFLSNGPGDPATARHEVALTAELLRRRMPIFGICFGNQILGRALGFGTYKLKYGHRGINQPVLDRDTGKVEVTAHNHGFAVAVAGREQQHSAVAVAGREQRLGAVAVAGREQRLGAVAVAGGERRHSAVAVAGFGGEVAETEFGRVAVTHVCLNDDVVEGLRCLDAPAYSVQYHPEAAAGPHDADYLFDRLTALIENSKGRPDA